MIELPIMAFTKVIKAPHPRSTAGFAQPAGCGGARQCLAKPRLRPPPLGGGRRMLAALEILND
jgi:hypothetical protein